MDPALAALLGALIGGLFTLAGAMAVELRRDRRRQLAGARLILSQLERSSVEVGLLTLDSDEAVHEGPHTDIRIDAWQEYAADLIGRLTAAEFDQVDALHAGLARDADWGNLQQGLEMRAEAIPPVQAIIERLAKPTWFDRHVWRL